MGKKAFIAAIVTSVFLFPSVGMLAVEIAEANPFFGWQVVDIAPGTIPPQITLLSPENNTVHSSSIVSLRFNISKPILSSAWESGIADVEYFLDGKETELYSMDVTPGLQEFSHASNLTLTEGNHTLIVHVGGFVLPNNLSVFGISNNSTVSFTVNTSNLPSPTQTAMLEPSPAPNKTEDSFAPLAIVAGLVIAAAVVGLLVILAKRRGGKT